MNEVIPLRSGSSEPERAGSPAPPGSPESLSALLHRSARGDEVAFAALYDATAARVHGLVLRVVRDPAQSDEVTQEAFLEVWRTSARFDPSQGSALSWLLTIAHRRAVDRVRSAESSSKRDTSFLRSDHRTEHDTTEEAAISRLEAERVRCALAQLTAVQREAVELAYFGGYTHTEIAALLDLPVGTAKTRIRDGLIRLRDTLGVTND